MLASLFFVGRYKEVAYLVRIVLKNASGRWSLAFLNWSSIGEAASFDFNHLYTHRCIPQAERIVCVEVFYYPASWPATR